MTWLLVGIVIGWWLRGRYQPMSRTPTSELQIEYPEDEGYVM